MPGRNGDARGTLGELAEDIDRQVGRSVVYNDPPEPEFDAAPTGNGLPPSLADLLADADAQEANGALLYDGRDLSRLTERPITPVGATITTTVTID